MNKSMMLITSAWGESKTFKMIPITAEAPYNECIFDADAKILAVISKEKKQSLHMLTKLTDLGDVQYLKIGKRQNGKDYAEERKLLETFYEYYVESKDEIVNLINMFAINNDTFDYDQYFNAAPKKAETSSIVTI
jgi:hypothetical protein